MKIIMSNLEDIYAVEDDDANDLERIIENDGAENDREDSDDENDRDDRSEAEEEKPRRVAPPGEKKTKIIRNPRVVLNPKRLTGPRGIKTIESFFQDFKFLGKGHEKEDLDVVMKRLEHWAHRLYPKFQFDDCIDKIATLGVKKEVSVHIRKIRLDMLTDDVPIIQEDSEEEGERAPVLDEFDLLLDQQIALARSTPAPIHCNNLSIQKDREAFFSTDMDAGDLGNISTPSRQLAAPQVSEDQRARMLKNRLLAEERRLQRMKQDAERESEV